MNQTALLIVSGRCIKTVLDYRLHTEITAQALTLSQQKIKVLPPVLRVTEG